MQNWDVIVIGGGSAGTSAASAAAALGARTLMINDGELGGLCILRGCMPTKTMLASAHAIHDVEHLEPLGIRLDGRVVPDFAAIMRRKDALVERFKRAKIKGIESDDYEVRIGRGRFTASGGVEVDGEELRAQAYVLSTGSLPWRAPIPGIDQVPVWSSDDVMRLKEPPQRLLIQGAGAVGLELGQFFVHMGTEVLLVNRSPLLARYDVDCGVELRQVLASEPGLRLAVPGRIESLRPDGDGLVAHVTCDGNEEEFAADALLMATGRRPALDGLGLEHVGLAPVDGLIRCDRRMATDNPAIWVAGDVTGTNQILHLANQEGAVAGHNAAGGEPREVDDRLKMDVIFTDPPFAHVGLSEDEAIARGHEIVVGRARFSQTGRAITMGVEHGAWKLVADRGSGEILGSLILGPRADDLIHTVALLMHCRATAEQILELPWYHPTLSEVLLELARDIASQRS